MFKWIEQEYGVNPLVLQGVIPPLIAFLLVFLARELILLVLKKKVGDPARQKVWRQRSLWIALPSSILLAWGASWLQQGDLVKVLAGQSSQIGQMRTYVGALLKIFVYTLLLVTALLIIRRVRRRLVGRIDSWKSVTEGVKVQAAVLLSPKRVRVLLMGGIRFVRGLLIFLLFYLYIPAVLSALPQTREIATKAIPYLMTPFVVAATGLYGYLPDLLILIAVMVIGGYVIKLLRHVMAAVGTGDIKLQGFDPEWSGPTYKLGRTLIILILIVISYPYLPGSQSEVFKGFSIFFGALITLGASSSISNVINGLILTYTGSFRVGDRVKIGDTVGDIVEKRMFSTRMRTPFNDAVSVPNSLVMESQIVNYSDASKQGGLALIVEAGIGYDVDWRTIHELFKTAASKTESVLENPEPFVLQSGLGDYAVQYKLVAFTDNAKRAARIASKIREHALDGFNQAGIEIMTPMVHAVRNSLDLTTPTGASETSAPPSFRLGFS
jgi:small-conductance mechanosensitive channel